MAFRTLNQSFEKTIKSKWHELASVSGVKKGGDGILGLKTKKRGRYDIDGRVANDTINETGDGLMCI